MSVSIEMSRLQTSRNIIRAKLVELGLASSTDKLDALAAIIENISNRGAVSVTVREGETITIPAGFHNGSGTVSGVAGGGNYALQGKTVTPTKKQQSIVPDSGYYGLSGVTVEAIPNSFQDVSGVTSKAENVLTGTIFVTSDGVVTPGAMANNSAVDKKLDVTTVTYIIPRGFHDGLGKVQITLETKSVTPTKSEQEIIPASGKVLSKVIVGAIPDKYQDVSKVNTTAPNVLDGTYFVDSTGVLVEGSMPDRGAVNATIDGLSVTSYMIPAGKHNGSGKVSLTSDIEDALKAI